MRKKLFPIRGMIFIFGLCLFMSLTDVFSQDLRRMPRPERDSILLAKSKAAILKYGEKEYWEHCLAPKISVLDWTFDENNTGRVMYIITYPYDTTLYLFDAYFAAKVRIWADNGNVFSVGFGNGYGYRVEDIEKNHSSYTKMKFSCISRPEYDREWERKRQEREKRMEIEHKRTLEKERIDAEKWRKELEEIVRQDSIKTARKRELEGNTQKKKRR